MLWGWAATMAPWDPRPCLGAVAQGGDGTLGSEGDRGGKGSFAPMDVVPKEPPPAAHIGAGGGLIPALSQGYWVWTSPREQQAFSELL